MIVLLEKDLVDISTAIPLRLQERESPFMDAKDLLMKNLVIEGHRDVYEQIYRTAIGEKMPIRDGVAPRLIRDGINITVYAISGDSYSHSQNTGRYLETALEQIDQFLEEAPRSEGMIQMVKTRGDLPEKPEPGTVKFLLHFEGCMALRGSIQNLRNFTALACAHCNRFGISVTSWATACGKTAPAAD